MKQSPCSGVEGKWETTKHPDILRLATTGNGKPRLKHVPCQSELLAPGGDIFHCPVCSRNFKGGEIYYRPPVTAAASEPSN